MFSSPVAVPTSLYCTCIPAQVNGTASLCKLIGAASLHKSMGDVSMGTASMYNSMGTESLKKSMGAASTSEVVTCPPPLLDASNGKRINSHHWNASRIARGARHTCDVRRLECIAAQHVTRDALPRAAPRPWCAHASERHGAATDKQGQSGLNLRAIRTSDAIGISSPPWGPR